METLVVISILLSILMAVIVFIAFNALNIKIDTETVSRAAFKEFIYSQDLSARFPSGAPIKAVVENRLIVGRVDHVRGESIVVLSTSGKIYAVSTNQVIESEE